MAGAREIDPDLWEAMTFDHRTYLVKLRFDLLFRRCFMQL